MLAGGRPKRVKLILVVLREQQAQRAPVSSHPSAPSLSTVDPNKPSLLMMGPLAVHRSRGQFTFRR